ncbi:MAG: tyrosine-type recombinase/integrase [Syntrophomonadaceae bacterium]
MLPSRSIPENKDPRNIWPSIQYQPRLAPIRFQDLRHGHATQLLELGEDITVISNRLGHSTITLTADTYAHVRERLQRKASDKLGKILRL